MDNEEDIKNPTYHGISSAVPKAEVTAKKQNKLALGDWFVANVAVLQREADNRPGLMMPK